MCILIEKKRIILQCCNKEWRQPIIRKTSNDSRIITLKLTLSLPIFWQFCSLSATFILTSRGIMESQAYKFSRILFFLPFLSITFHKYPKFEVSKSRIHWTLHNFCKERDLNKARGGCPSRRSATLAVKELNPSRRTVLPAPRDKGNKCEFTRTRQLSSIFYNLFPYKRMSEYRSIS